MIRRIGVTGVTNIKDYHNVCAICGNTYDEATTQEDINQYFEDGDTILFDEGENHIFFDNSKTFLYYWDMEADKDAFEACEIISLEEFYKRYGSSES
jgi:hypothetical protein